MKLCIDHPQSRPDKKKIIFTIQSADHGRGYDVQVSNDLRSLNSTFPLEVCDQKVSQKTFNVCQFGSICSASHVVGAGSTENLYRPSLRRKKGRIWQRDGSKKLRTELIGADYAQIVHQLKHIDPSIGITKTFGPFQTDKNLIKNFAENFYEVLRLKRPRFTYFIFQE